MAAVSPFSIKHETGIPNSSDFTDFDLFDLNKVLSEASQEYGTLKNFYSTPGFIASESNIYYQESNLAANKFQNLLAFNGVNQGLAMDFSSTKSCYTLGIYDVTASFYVKFFEDGQTVEPLYSFLSSRGSKEKLATRETETGIFDTAPSATGLRNGFDFFYHTPSATNAITFARNGAGLITFSGVQKNVWYHVIAGSSGLTTQMFVNSSIVGTGVAFFNADIADIEGGKLIVGADAFGSAVDDTLAVRKYFNMQLCDLHIWTGYPPNDPLIINTQAKNLCLGEFTQHNPNNDAGFPDPLKKYWFTQSGCKAITSYYALGEQAKSTSQFLDEKFTRFNSEIFGKNNEYISANIADPTIYPAWFDGMNDRILIKNKHLIDTDGFKRYPVGSRKGYTPDLNGALTLEMWIKPTPFIQNLASSSFTGAKTGSSFDGQEIGLCLLSNCLFLSGTNGIDDYLDGVNPDLMSGVDLSLGTNSAKTVTYFNLILLNSTENIRLTISTPKGLGDAWEWTHIAAVIDISTRKLIFYITEKPNIYPNYTAEIDLTGFVNGITNGQDIFSSVSSESDVSIGARRYEDMTAPTDFYQGRMCDLKIWKTARSYDQIKDQLYSILI